MPIKKEKEESSSGAASLSAASTGIAASTIQRTDKRPLISNLLLSETEPLQGKSDVSVDKEIALDKGKAVDNGTINKGTADKDTGNVEDAKRPVIKKLTKELQNDQLKFPHPQAPQTASPLPPMVPTTYYGHYPDYYQYYNQYSAYYQQLPPLAQPPLGPSQADMIHLYNSYLYQNYSNHSKLAYAHHQLQQQQQQVLEKASPEASPPVVEVEASTKDQKSESDKDSEEEDSDFKRRHPTLIRKSKRQPPKIPKHKVTKPEKGKNKQSENDKLPNVVVYQAASESSWRPFACGAHDCDWSFARLSDLKRHMKSHLPPQFQCPYWRNDPTCHRNGGAFNRLDVLKRHLKLVHFVQDKALPPENYKLENGWCRSCQKQFPNVKEFLDHVNDCSSKLVPTEWKQHYETVNSRDK